MYRRSSKNRDLYINLALSLLSISQKYLHIYIYCIIIHNSEIIQAISISNQGVDSDSACVHDEGTFGNGENGGWKGAYCQSR